ncbi:MAG: TRAP transporter substrate-binding protein [Thermoflexales bacterium]
MQRRDFLKSAAKTAALGAASTVFTAPTVVRAQVRWQMATSWPVSLDTVYGGAEFFAQRVAALTDGGFIIEPQPAGKLAPGTQVLDAVSQGAVPIGHTPSYYYTGKSPVMTFGTTVPFGMTARQQNAWFYEGGGLELLQEIYAAKFNVIFFPAGNTGVQMGGWFRKPINAVRDLQGLKMRIPGLGGEVMKRLGVTVQTLPPSEIFQALQTGVVDAAEWVGPYDDEKLGFYKVAKYYYYPGWWDPGPSLEIEINLDAWNSLPKTYQEAVRSAAMEANMSMLARYDARNAAALERLRKQGVRLQRFSRTVMDAARRETEKILEEYAASDPDFKRVYDNWKAFKAQTDRWFGLAELSMQTYQFTGR